MQASQTGATGHSLDERELASFVSYAKEALGLLISVGHQASPMIDAAAAAVRGAARPARSKALLGQASWMAQPHPVLLTNRSTSYIASWFSAGPCNHETARTRGGSGLPYPRAKSGVN